MANSALSEFDVQAERQYTSFADAIKYADVELAKETGNTFFEIVERRNQK